MPQVPPAQPSVQTTAPTLAAGAAAAVCIVSSTAREGKEVGVGWATPLMSPPAVSMPGVLQMAFAGAAANAAGGGLAHRVVLISPAKKLPIPKRAAMAGRPLCHASASGDVAASKAAGGWPGAIPLAPDKSLVEARAAAADRLLVGAAASPDYDASQAARGRSACAVVPNPPSTSDETLIAVRPVAVVAGDCPICAFPCQKIGNKFDCCTGGMLGATVGPSPAGPTSLPMEPVSVASPSSGKSLPSAGKPRAVVDAGGASLPSTERSRAVVDTVVALLPLAARPRTVDDASSLSLSLSDSTRGDNIVCTVLSST